MAAPERTNLAGTRLFAVRLHDASAGLAIGIGLLKSSTEAKSVEWQANSQLAIEALEEVLTELRQLSRSIPGRTASRTRAGSVRQSLERDARTARVELELILIGDDAWLTDDQLELVRLAGREAIGNVKLHSGANRCRIAVDVSTCPFVLTVRDWGAGIQPSARAGRGIAFLEDLARGMGAKLAISSQPGLGVELTLTGPCCVKTGNHLESNDGNVRLRSVVAHESPSSRKRVADKRPLGASEQQIT